MIQQKKYNCAGVLCKTRLSDGAADSTIETKPRPENAASSPEPFADERVTGQIASFQARKK
ncbi:hypothetical protein [Paenibacillus faecis]|uniref:hypothetical protein n=1 Tax=Paenibacillus faecis TaxID=862114 RepID=UPI001BD01A98|nr:hypothetical protein [Paenibacillus faecis]